MKRVYRVTLNNSIWYDVESDLVEWEFILQVSGNDSINVYKLVDSSIFTKNNYVAIVGNKVCSVESIEFK